MKTQDPAIPLLAGRAAAPGLSDARGTETMPDVVTSMDAYAERFSGRLGRYFLEVQGTLILSALSHLPPGSAVLDVGGGHAQLTPYLLDAGFEVLTVGSERSCSRRLAPWSDDERLCFQVADLLNLPYPADSFDAVVAVRLMAHVPAWRDFLTGLCRLARDTVAIDYPSLHSVNRFADRLFLLKRELEGDTRPFSVYEPTRIRQAFADEGFRVGAVHPQFLLPMALYRSLGSAGLARSLEGVARLSGLTRLLGSPVITAARREDATEPEDRTEVRETAEADASVEMTEPAGAETA